LVRQQRDRHNKGTTDLLCVSRYRNWPRTHRNFFVGTIVQSRSFHLSHI